MSALVLRFGNPSPQHQVEVPQQDGSTQRVSMAHPWLKQSVTRVEFAPHVVDEDEVRLALSTENDRVLSMIGRQLAEADKRWAVALNELEQIVSAHTGGVAPTWVRCDDEDLQRVAAEHFRCIQGEPQAGLTTVGRDALHAQHLTTGAQPAAFNYMAVTANATAFNAADTTLTGEITTAGGGLLRAQATYAHTAGTNTSTLTKTFTANGSDSLPVTIAKIGVFNAVTVGTMGYETVLTSTATLTASGDSLTVTDTVTGG